jgi:hypothetical protein
MQLKHSNYQTLTSTNLANTTPINSPCTLIKDRVTYKHTIAHTNNTPPGAGRFIQNNSSCPIYRYRRHTIAHSLCNRWWFLIKMLGTKARSRLKRAIRLDIKPHDSRWSHTTHFFISIHTNRPFDTVFGLVIYGVSNSMRSFGIRLANLAYGFWRIAQGAQPYRSATALREMNAHPRFLRINSVVLRSVALRHHFHLYYHASTIPLVVLPLPSIITPQASPIFR